MNAANNTSINNEIKMFSNDCFNKMMNIFGLISGKY